VDVRGRTVQIVPPPPYNSMYSFNVLNDVDSVNFKNGLKVLYSNVDSLINKRTELLHVMEDGDFDLIVFTEVLPKNCKSIQECELYIDNYDLFIRSLSSGRGVAIYVKSSLKANLVDDLTEDEFIESVWCRIKLVNTDSLLVGAIYRSPSSSEDNNRRLNELLIRATSVNDSHLLVAGDFNFKDIDWELKECLSNDQQQLSFLECFNDCYLYQHVLEPTRYREGNQPSILDLVCSNEEQMIDSIQYMEPLGKSDHVMLSFTFNCYSTDDQEFSPRYVYHKGDYDKLNQLLVQSDWEVHADDDIDTLWSKFKDNLQDAVSASIPMTKPGSKVKKKKWLNSAAIKAVSDKRKAWKKYKYCKNESNHQIYVQKRNIATNKCRLAKRNFEKLICQNVKEDPKSFWKYIRTQCKTKSVIGDIEDSGTLISDSKTKADLFNKFFSGVFINEDKDDVPQLESRIFNDELKDIVVTSDIVKKKLLRLNHSKSPGGDQIHPRILKENAEVICDYLSIMFQMSINVGHLPEDWRSAIVVPLHKKGSKKKVENFRPVSLTSIVCKLLESIVRDYIMSHMDSNNLFIIHQHGFRPKHSCVTQLLEVIDEWYEILDEGGNIDTVYLDFQKAFDTVPHRRLMNKLYSYGIRGKVQQWIENFLSNRKQHVKIGNAMSSVAPVISGIPQGSVLGPILFLVFINDMPDAVQSYIKLFADDAKVYRPINAVSDCSYLQEDLDTLSSWSEKWLLKFNPSKCKSMHIGRHNPSHEYHLKTEDEEFPIAQTSSEKDLGVTFDDRMKFDIHVSNIVKKANQILGLIRRSFEYLDSEMFLMLYKTLIRPHLEYATVIWSPWLKKDIVAIEQVQRRATRLVKELQHLSYDQRLLHLGLPTLIYRRQRSDMIQLFKILNGYDQVHLKSLQRSHNTTTRGHEMKLVKKHHNYKSTMNSFVPRSVTDWNYLPAKCVNSGSVNSFKSTLNEAWKQRQNKFYYDF